MTEFTQNAQQVLRDGKHFADTHSAADAAEIVRALTKSMGRPESTGQEPGTTETTTRLRMPRTPEGTADTAEQAFGPAGCDGPMDTVDQIATYLDAQADKRPRRRQFTQGIRFAAQEVRARMWEQDEAAPEGVRARYSEETAHG